VCSTVRASPGMRRGRRYREDLPVPGASSATVCTLCAFRARSNGTEITKLAPMPVSTSSGSPAPRTEVRSRSPSTSTYRMRGLLSSRGADTGDVLPRDERLPGLGVALEILRAMPYTSSDRSMLLLEASIETNQDVPLLGRQLWVAADGLFRVSTGRRAIGRHGLRHSGVSN